MVIVAWGRDDVDVFPITINPRQVEIGRIFAALIHQRAAVRNGKDGGRGVRKRHDALGDRKRLAQQLQFLCIESLGEQHAIAYENDVSGRCIHCWPRGVE